MSRNAYRVLLYVSLIICIATGMLSIMAGNSFISPADIWHIVTGEADSIYKNIFYYSRLPRTVGAMLSGAALATSGAVLQNVLSNKLASPGIIGVNAGAGLGVTICCSLGFLTGGAVSLFSFTGSLLTVFIITIFSSKVNASKTTVILAGVALNSILGALSESLAVLDSDVALLSTEFRVGGFSSVSYTRLIPAGAVIIIVFVILFTLFNELDIVALGDDTALSLGLKVRKYRNIFLVTAALLAGAAVSYTGLLGFVGLIVPHFVRKIVGNEGSRLIPITILYGAIFVCGCDTLTRLLFMPYEMPVGILMSVIGGPVFIYMLVSMRGGHKNA